MSSDLRERLTAFLSTRIGASVEVDDLVRVPGGASRETWTFTTSTPDGERRLVLRRDPPGPPARSERRTEFDLLERVGKAGVPVPTVRWYASADDLGSAGFVMDFVEGETIARRVLRDDAYARARRMLAGQCGDVLAKIHAVDIDGLGGFDPPDDNPGAAVLARFRDLYDSFGEPHPAFELGLRWLEARIPEPSRVTLVHGDFRHGNLIIGPDGLRAVIDWELPHLGDPWEDLAWLCTRSWRFGGPGEVGGFGNRADLYAAYERSSGVAVDAETVHWWEVLSNVKWGVMTMMQAFTHLWGHVRSVELAAIGRRTCETEYDLLRLLKDAR